MYGCVVLVDWKEWYTEHLVFAITVFSSGVVASSTSKVPLPQWMDHLWAGANY